MTQRSNGAENGITALFVRRPVLAFVLNTLIAVAGLAALFGIEIRELPDVDRPVITVNTTFPGASAESIDRELTAVIEGAIARVSGVKSISSSSSFGRSRVTVEFNDGVNLDTAASDMRDAVSRIQNRLPDDADPPNVVKADADAQAIVRLAITSDTMSVHDMTVLVEDQITDAFASIDGVAEVQVYGGGDKIFRVDIDQSRLASLGLTVADVRNALATMAFDTPAGSLTSNDQDLIVRATAPVTTPEEFENIIVNGTARLRDFASVTLGGDVGESQLRANGKTGIGMGIIRQAQSNTLQISEDVHAAIERLKPTLPAGVDIFVTGDEAVFINGAIHEVEIALGISATVVLVIIFLFLLDWRATLIPGLALPVALIGTVAAIYLAGYSMNILTLMAFVLAAGLVVDDAIVVLENIVRRRNEGMGPRAAAVLGTQEVFFAVVATTATLVAVFVQLSFLPGQTGGLPLIRLHARRVGRPVGRGCPVTLPHDCIACVDRERRGNQADWHFRHDRTLSWQLLSPHIACSAEHAAGRDPDRDPADCAGGGVVSHDPFRAHAIGRPLFGIRAHFCTAGRQPRLSQPSDARS